MQYTQLRDPGRRLDLATASPLPTPLTIYVEPTNVCNFRCAYCPESFEDYKETAGGFHRLNPVSFERVAAEIAALGRLKTLNFYMLGEPFLNRALPEYIARATSLQLAERTCVTTNASILDANTIDRVLESGLTFLRVSVYGATEETARARTAATISLERVHSNVAAFRKARDLRGLTQPFLYAKMIETGDPAEDRAFLEMFGPICDEVALEPAMNWNDPDGKNLALITREEMLKREHFRYTKKACPFPFYTLVIHADLRVSVCCVDWAKQAVVGDLKHESLKEIWLGAKLQAFRLTHLKGERHSIDACAACTYLHTTPDNIDSLTPSAYLSRIGSPT